MPYLQESVSLLLLSTAWAVPDQVQVVSARTVWAPAPIPGQSSLAVGDVDGDGDADFVVFDLAYGLADTRVLLLENDGAATPVWFVRTLAAFSGATLPGQPQLHDCDNDGDLDLFFVFDVTLKILENTGTSSWPMFVEQVMCTRGSAKFLAIADIDGDGVPDSVVACSSPDLTILW